MKLTLDIANWMYITIQGQKIQYLDVGYFLSLGESEILLVILALFFVLPVYQPIYIHPHIPTTSNNICALDSSFNFLSSGEKIMLLFYIESKLWQFFLNNAVGYFHQFRKLRPNVEKNSGDKELTV